MKSIVIMLGLGLFCTLGKAVPRRPATQAAFTTTELATGWPKIRIHFEHGDWDDEQEKCVDGKGLCKISIDIIFNQVSTGEGMGDLWYDGEHLHLVGLANTYDPRTYQSVYRGAEYNLSKPFQLPDNVCAALGIKPGYQILPGTYPVRNAGAGYSNADREIIF